MLAFCEYIQPDRSIDIVSHWNTNYYNKNISQIGDHELYVDNLDARNVKANEEILISKEFL